MSSDQEKEARVMLAREAGLGKEFPQSAPSAKSCRWCGETRSVRRSGLICLECDTPGTLTLGGVA